MIILGISDSREPGAALVAQDTLIAAAAEAPLRRARCPHQLPTAAIDAVLEIGGFRARDVSRVVMAGMFTPGPLSRFGIRSPGPTSRRLRRDATLRETGLHMIVQEACAQTLSARLGRIGLGDRRVHFIEHDRCHAYAAYRGQPRDRVLVVAVDDGGDGAALSVNLGHHAQLERLYFQSAHAAIASFSARVSTLLGQPGRPLDRFDRDERGPDLSAELRAEGAGFNLAPRPVEPDPLARVPPLALAAGAQDTLERAVIEVLRYHLHAHTCRDLAVAGELFRNSRLCARIAEMSELDSLFVFPEPGDAGLAVGAALGFAGVGARRMSDPCLGPRWTDEACYRALSNASLPRQRVDDPEAEVARLIHQGLSVARFAGPLELSQHGLGNRSVLSSPDRPGPGGIAKNGAATLAEHAEGYLHLARCADAARFQTLALPVTASFAAAYAGVLRPDGRVEVQLVKESDDPTFHRLLRLWRARSGHATLRVTTLTDSAGLVAASPMDTIQCWRAGDSDALLLGPYLVRRE